MARVSQLPGRNCCKLLILCGFLDINRSPIIIFLLQSSGETGQCIGDAEESTFNEKSIARETAQQSGEYRIDRGKRV
jgi:hypothetical protein